MVSFKSGPYPGFVLVGVGVTGHEEVEGEIRLLHRLAVPLLHGVREEVLVLEETFRAETLDTLIVTVGRSPANL